MWLPSGEEKAVKTGGSSEPGDDREESIREVVKVSQEKASNPEFSSLRLLPSSSLIYLTKQVRTTYHRKQDTPDPSDCLDRNLQKSRTAGPSSPGLVGVE